MTCHDMATLYLGDRKGKLSNQCGIQKKPTYQIDIETVNKLALISIRFLSKIHNFIPKYNLMLQRIQSLYLLVAAIVFAMLFFLNIYKVETTTAPVQVISMSVTTITLFQIDNPSPAPPQFRVFPFTLNLILFILVIVTIFWYKNRVQQNLLAKLCMLLNSGLIVLLLLSTDKLKTMLVSSAYIASYQAGIIFPVISLALLYLASGAIMKDENLVRSADRLR